MNLYSLLCIIPDLVPETVIKELLDNKSEEFSQATVGFKDDKPSDHRKTKWLNLPENTYEKLRNFCLEIDKNILSNFYKSTFKSLEPPQFLRYDVGDYYKPHNDCEHFEKGRLKRLINRDISFLLYLNDNFEGGEIEFIDLQLTLKPKKGMLLAFPSYLEFSHVVHPVTSGTRYTIVSWIETEKRLYDRPYENSIFLPRKWVLPG